MPLLRNLVLYKAGSLAKISVQLRSLHVLVSAERGLGNTNSPPRPNVFQSAWMGDPCEEEDCGTSQWPGSWKTGSVLWIGAQREQQLRTGYVFHSFQRVYILSFYSKESNNGSALGRFKNPPKQQQYSIKNNNKRPQEKRQQLK